MLIPSAEYVDRILNEDVPYLDLTTYLLDLPSIPGQMTFTARHRVVAAGIPLVRAVLERLGAEIVSAVTSGTELAAGQALLSAAGPPAVLHQGWKVGANVFESACGIATRTAELVAAARATNPEIEVFTTRKVMPGTKELALEAILAGGALPHRLGLSETVLIFDQHTAFIGGLDGLIQRLPRLAARACEKLVLVEVSTAAQAIAVAKAGAGGIQFDKVPAGPLAEMVKTVRAAVPGVRLIAAGGISSSNAAEYAATGVDALATSWMYGGTPADIGVTIEPR
jgi:molybdenum transport protein